MSNLHEGHVVRPGFENHGRRHVAWNACAHGRTTIFGYLVSPVASGADVDEDAPAVDDGSPDDDEDDGAAAAELSTSIGDSRPC